MPENTTTIFPDRKINSYLSFKPLVTALKKTIAEGNPGMKTLYGHVVHEFESHKELNGTITDTSVLFPNSELIEELLSAVFPPTTANYMYGISIPFRFEAVYGSPLFKKNLVSPNSNTINLPRDRMGESLEKERLHFACGLILKKYLNYNNPDGIRALFPSKDADTGLTRYMEMRLDGRFIDVRPKDKMPELPSTILNAHNNRLMTIAELADQLPIEEFVFEGVTPIRINDVTETVAVNEIKNNLLHENPFSDNEKFNALLGFVRSLLGLNDIAIGVTPFFKVQGHYIYSELENCNSLLFNNKMASQAERDEISDYCKLLFRDNTQPLLFETLTEDLLNEVQCLPYYHKLNARSVIISPLVQRGQIIGLLEVTSGNPEGLKPLHVNKLELVIPYFATGMNKTLEVLNNNIDRVIKQKFTAVQPAVEWKFTDAALKYIEQSRDNNGKTRLEKIVLTEVYPLYGAIDIRGSSVARSKSVQADVLDQLALLQKVIQKAELVSDIPLLQEVEFKISKLIAAASDTLQSEEEISIYDFLNGEAKSVLQLLLHSEPSLQPSIENYFAALDPEVGVIYHKRKQFDQSVAHINDTLAHLLDKEETAAQKVYPHYFERYVTDGLEFNIYMGQAINPRKKFDEIYLRNMKMWQLYFLAKAAKATHDLEKDLPCLLKTTQLILCHSQPLSISFRTEERKFDVDGAYNTRFEIVKKRIDKAHIKDSDERLTQPGKIAIVYSKNKDAEEYKEYIEFLQNKDLLKPGVEQLELEELQGVVGLKALRVECKF